MEDSFGTPKEILIILRTGLTGDATICWFFRGGATLIMISGRKGESLLTDSKPGKYRNDEVSAAARLFLRAIKLERSGQSLHTRYFLITGRFTDKSRPNILMRINSFKRKYADSRVE